MLLIERKSDITRYDTKYGQIAKITTYHNEYVIGVGHKTSKRVRWYWEDYDFKTRKEAYDFAMDVNNFSMEYKNNT